MSLVYMASYEIFVYVEKNEIINKGEVIIDKMNENKDEIIYKIKKLLRKDMITVVKEGKKGTKEINIKPLIVDLEIKFMDDLNVIKEKNDNRKIYKITAMLRAGGEANLKPDLLISAINKHTDLSLKIIRIHRTGLFINKDGVLEKPM